MFFGLRMHINNIFMLSLLSHYCEKLNVKPLFHCVFTVVLLILNVV